MKVLKFSHENQSGSVLIMIETVKRQLLPEELGSRRMEWRRPTRQGKQLKEIKKDEATDKFLPFVWEQREDRSESSFAHVVSQKNQSWTEVRHQQAPGRLEARPSPTPTITLLANRITATFSSSPSVCWRTTWKGCGRCDRNGVLAPSWAGAITLKEPCAGSAGSRTPWQRYRQPRRAILGPGHPPYVLQRQRFRHVCCFNLASD